MNIYSTTSNRLRAIGISLGVVALIGIALVIWIILTPPAKRINPISRIFFGVTPTIAVTSFPLLTSDGVTIGLPVGTPVPPATNAAQALQTARNENPVATANATQVSTPEYVLVSHTSTQAPSLPQLTNAPCWFIVFNGIPSGSGDSSVSQNTTSPKTYSTYVFINAKSGNEYFAISA